VPQHRSDPGRKRRRPRSPARRPDRQGRLEGLERCAFYAAEGNFVLVTNNATDFREIYATTALHAGLIIIVPNLGRAMQAALFRTALGAVTMPDDLVNRVLEVSLDGEEITLELYDLPQDPAA
jgi:hypothetical protein